MRYPFTDEMNRLMKIYKPYEEGCHLVPNAPQEAIDAKKKFIELAKEEEKKNSRIDLL